MPVALPVTIGPITAAQRGNHTGFVHVTANGVVPAGTVWAEVDVTMTRVSLAGPYNDGYADNLSLVLLPSHPLFLPAMVR